MKMRYLILVLGALALSACQKDFLDRKPQTNITNEAFFNNAQDLQTYTNGFYANLSAASDDIGSDNLSVYNDNSVYYNLLRGTVTPSNVTGWSDWGVLRGINYLFDNAGRATGDTAAIHHYIGVGRFFRALFYFGKLQNYSDVPWYSHAEDFGDSSLYKPADPRTLVADSILGDLQYAVDHMSATQGDRTQVNKYTALALMSRFCLYEGTYRKYHPEVNLGGDYKRFLEQSVWAAQQLMASNQFSISNTGAGALDYRNLFVSSTLSGNKEMIMWSATSPTLGVANNTHIVYNYLWGLSRSLEETYLMQDGTPFTAQANYDKKGFTDVFTNRDPRMAETFCYPGFSTLQDPNKPEVYAATYGGYDQLKFYPRDPAQRQGWQLDYTALPIFRYAEVLLNYAEAQAELGNIDQATLDQSVNLLRARVKMPKLDMATANASMDAVLAAQYPGVSGANKGVLLEIRRERRVEMACEGLRRMDIFRWAAGQLLGNAPQGMYVPALGGIDVTGDGVADVAILNAPGEEGPIAGLPDNVKANLAKYYLVDANGKPTPIYLTNGTSGFIAFNADKTARTFVAPKYYYLPIPLQQTVLNKNLKQVYGW